MQFWNRLYETINDKTFEDFSELNDTIMEVIRVTYQPQQGSQPQGLPQHKATKRPRSPSFTFEIAFAKKARIQ
jgi:hypothetical protein